MKRGDRGYLTGRVVAVVAVLVLALGTTACSGSDDDGDPGGPNGGAPAAANEAAANEEESFGSGPEGQIKSLYSEFGDAMLADDAEAACATLTRRAQKRFGGDGSCEQRFEAMFKNTSGSGGQKAFIVKLKIHGDKAKAGVKTKTSQIYPVDFAKEDGEWKISGDGQ